MKPSAIRRRGAAWSPRKRPVATPRARPTRILLPKVIRANAPSRDPEGAAFGPSLQLEPPGAHASTLKAGSLTPWPTSGIPCAARRIAVRLEIRSTRADFTKSRAPLPARDGRFPLACVFAYGSLMGDALLGRYRPRPARLPGYRRAFLHESRRRWGTPAAPCPILGLVPGDECWGLAFDIPDAERRVAQSALEKREGAQERRRETRTLETPDGPVDAWVWVSLPPGSGGIDLAAIEARLRAAHGVVGTGVEYVRTVVHAMELHGVHDPLIETLWKRLRD